MSSESPQDHPLFFTATCLSWEFLLADDDLKDIIISSMQFLSAKRRVRIFAFCIMSNHIHIIWQMLGNHERQNVQRDFLKFTGRQILKKLRQKRSELVPALRVELADREFQVWQRRAMSISLESDFFFFQKLNYIHNNPVAAGLVKLPADYHYSSARFYFRSSKNFDFLVHFEG